MGLSLQDQHSLRQQQRTCSLLTAASADRDLTDVRILQMRTGSGFNLLVRVEVQAVGRAAGIVRVSTRAILRGSWEHLESPCLGFGALSHQTDPITLSHLYSADSHGASRMRSLRATSASNKWQRHATPCYWLQAIQAVLLTLDALRGYGAYAC